MDLIAFLRARLDEDAEMVRRNSERRGLSEGFPDYRTYDGEDLDAADDYIDHFGPKRMAAEVETKRRILDEYERADPGFRDWKAGYEDGLERAARLLALPYADHPDYREEWRP